jgi:choice-of-anchor B domain-containing protein
VLPELYGTTAATDHNLYIRGRYMYQSNYSAGLRILDVNDSKNAQEVAYFDTYPNGNAKGFVGTWTNFPYFLNDGVVAVTSIAEGLFLVRHRPAAKSR